MRLSDEERAAAKVLSNPRYSEESQAVFVDLLSERMTVRLGYVLAVVARCKRLRAARGAA